MKNSLGKSAVQRITKILAIADPLLDVKLFEREALRSLDKMELKQRVEHIIDALHKILPDDFAQTAAILIRCKAHWIDDDTGDSYGAFAAWPFIDYSAKYGLAHPELSLNTLKELTELFSAEFAIRPFIIRHYDLTMHALSTWKHDDNEHVRRLVSEGTRPRLPWGLQLKNFIEAPKDCLPFLSHLKADDSLYVRRSVANHLNDIAKDHPELVLDTCIAWQQELTASHANETVFSDEKVEEVNWVIRHATRTLVKAGHPKSFKLLGYTESPKIDVSTLVIDQPSITGEETLSFNITLENTKKSTQKFVLDYAIHFVKANGERKPKVFKLKNCELTGNSELKVTKKHSFKKISTRKYYDGEHLVELFINGKSIALASFNYFL